MVATRAQPLTLVAPGLGGDSSSSDETLVFDALPAPLERVLVGVDDSLEPVDHRWAGPAEEDACALLGACGLDGGEQLSMMLCNDERIRELNNQWRAIDKPTDVLSFPMDDDQLLGDLVISLDTARAQAKERDHSLRDEMRVSHKPRARAVFCSAPARPRPRLSSPPGSG